MAGNDQDNNSLASVEAALDYGGKLYDGSDDFDEALDHVVCLLGDAAALFDRGSVATAAFLAITAMEETAKAHVGVYRREKLDSIQKGRDPLRDHNAKHRIAIAPTVFMSERIMAALGRDCAAGLRGEAQTIGFSAKREAALYCASGLSGFESPQKAISARCAWELLILAVEAADDALVGYTDHSYEVGRDLDALFAHIAAQTPTS